ncbi:hypothetical protein [Parasediminibacterium sp. JCM 36343]|uniref:hypothetical protein n=1 Tax=Parasediminibacterium sp. JCM 36343 TaxID=3374279 RepID=UPI00397954CA
MALDFNKASFTETTSATIFGICDTPPPATNSAYLDYAKSDDWIACVENDLSKPVIFTAIDHCTDIVPPDAERCDGMLRFEDTIIFVELKDRNSGRWLGKAKDQLSSTINIYKKEIGLNGLTKFYAYVSNKQRPYFYAANMSLAEEFEADTGFVLQVEQVIKIQ